MDDDEDDKISEDKSNTIIQVIEVSKLVVTYMDIIKSNFKWVLKWFHSIFCYHQLFWSGIFCQNGQKQLIDNLLIHIEVNLGHDNTTKSNPEELIAVDPMKLEKEHLERRQTHFNDALTVINESFQKWNLFNKLNK